MSLEGKIVNRNGSLFVLCANYHSADPLVTYLWFRIERVTANPYGHERPEEGDLVRYADSGVFHVTNRLAGSVYTGSGDSKADHVETVSVPCPPTRGKEARWYNGRWEKRLVKGWVAA